MKIHLRLFWWIIYICGAIIVQKAMPGVDALMPGFLLSLQEKNTKQSLWLFVIFVLVQEGSGSLMFGSSLLWYGGQALFFRLSRQFFIADSLLFVIMLSVILGAYHAALTWFMCAMQKIPLDYAILTHEVILQTLIIPAIWGLAHLTRPKAHLHSA